MARTKISSKFRDRLSEKLMELGNLILVTMVIGQFVSEKGFSIGVFFVGLLIAAFCYLAAYIISS